MIHASVGEQQLHQRIDELSQENRRLQHKLEELERTLRLQAAASRILSLPADRERDPSPLVPVPQIPVLRMPAGRGWAAS